MIRLLMDRGITNELVLGAMTNVERHQFVPDTFVNRAYDDCALPIGKGQTISQPYTVAYMTQALSVVPGAKVLEIGTGSGYQAAILAEMGARVFSIERDLDLLRHARKIIDRLGYRVAMKGGDGTVGWLEYSPFDGIVVTAGAPSIPDPLLKQLAEGGKLVIPVGDMDVQSIIICTRRGERIDREEALGFKFVPLIGKMGWR
jgi:protein-L-isoaspartate(D-aspartate) O-methyltransferase